MNHKENNLVSFFLDKGYLISPDFIDKLDSKFNKEYFFDLIDKKILSKEKPIILNNDLKTVLNNGNSNLDINWFEFENSKALLEKGKDGKIYTTFLDILQSNISDDKKKLLKNILDDVKKPEEDIDLTNNKDDLVNPEDKKGTTIILDSYLEDPKKRDIKDFVSYFKVRYESIKKLLMVRQELQNLVSINRLFNKNQIDTVSIIGLVSEKYTTKNGNILLKVEDITGFISVLVSKEKKEIFEESSNIVEDEIIGIVGVVRNKLFFANNIIWPDIPMKEFKKSSDEVYAAFISDLHIGSKMFLSEDFKKFIKWIKGDLGNQKQKEICKKLKYLFIVGDLIDGCGIYPGQDKELVLKDVYKQYELCAEILSEVREDITIIICPGNHDALRIAEPQPALYKDFAKPLWDLPNVIMVSNPSLVNIHSSEDFLGFDVLLYHGYSFDYYVKNVNCIRENGGYDRTDLLMKFLLQRRHLAPTHTSTLYIPTTKEDPLFIKKVPDFFVTAHVHKLSATNYKTVTMICCSCWQAKTTFQEKVGHEPDPSKVPLVNLKTREVKILKFGS
ncbi:DNA polymerase II [archaeon]|nr:DNA polymerase II [archaeon]|tara:strand:- start:2799 stop:4475 length:1677 start_codon:yes stop_codon:yes gene_type:complete